VEAGPGMERKAAERFVEDGFLVIREAIAPETVRACVNIIENELLARGVDCADPVTWTEPVVRIPCPDAPAFAAAGTSPRLWETYWSDRPSLT